MAKKETSDRLSEIAGRWQKITFMSLLVSLANYPADTVREIRSIAASVKAQDETKGRRK